MEPIATWSLEELSARVEAALAHGQIGQTNGQVTEVPNGRTIRYYATIGLLDRPWLSGRAARYGHRHLLQLVAIKRLQAQGLPLVDIQRKLPTLGDVELTALAALPPTDDSAAMAAEVHGPMVRPAPARRDASFWSSPPPTPAPPAQAPVGEPSTEQTVGEIHQESHIPAATVLAGLNTSEGVALTFPAARALTNDDMNALRAAFGPVVEVLRARGLLPGPQGEEP